jgi:hypothetical protein
MAFVECESHIAALKAVAAFRYGSAEEQGTAVGAERKEGGAWKVYT